MVSPDSDPHPDNLPSPNTLPPLAGSALVIRGQFAHTLGGSNFDSGPSDLVSTLDLTAPIPAGTQAQAYFTSSRSVPLRVADPLVAFSPRGRVRLAGGSTHNASNLWAPNVRGLFEYDADRDDWATLVPAAAAQGTAALIVQALLPIGCSVPTTLFASTGSTVGQVVYAFGGKEDATGPNAKYVDDLKRVSMLDKSVVVEVIDKAPSGGVWPQARASALVLPLNDTHVLLSGGVGQDGKGLKDWWVFDIAKSQWTRGPSELTAARYSHRGVLFDERHVIQTGGWLDSPTAPFLESIDLVTGTVTHIPAQLAPDESDELLMAKYLARHNMIVAGDQLILYGGYAEFNDSLPVLRHNRRLYVASLSYSHSGTLAAHWQSQYRPTLLLPPNYLRNGRPGDHAPYVAVAIVLVAMVASTLVLGGVRARLMPHTAAPSGTWWMWWRHVSFGRRRHRPRAGRPVSATSSREWIAFTDARQSHDTRRHSHDAAAHLPAAAAAAHSMDSPTTLVDDDDDADESAWPERNQSRRAAAPHVFSTASSSAPAGSPPVRPASSSLGAGTTLASSSATSSPSGHVKPTVSMLPTPSMVRRGLGERVLSVPELPDPLPLPIPVSPEVVAREVGTQASGEDQAQARELHVRPVVVGGSLASSRAASVDGESGRRSAGIGLG